jgi:alkanesulfonate monooxygenase SsuD/methylene tetrahydromethanopterin reductase-like flavin-dependent oxidoreductase (luciferase family)
MDFYHFSEQPYPEAWELGLDSLRNTIPNALCDPRKAADIYHQRLDEWVYCDELGINIALNEHHSSATCLSASPIVPTAILSRQTKNVKIMPLGFQIANRPDPVRVAEELAMVDVISRGRLVIGLVKGAPFELSPANSNPGRYMERFWEAHDLILKALATRDGPFNFEGEFYHYRQVNIWPQPWQQPHPPVFIPAQSHDSTVEIARRGHGLAVFLAGRNVKKLYDSYKKVALDLGRPMPGADKFAYLCLVGVGDTEAEGHRRAHDIHGYLRTTGIISEPFMNPPGYMTVMGNVGWLRKNQTRGRAGHHYPATMKSGRVINQATATIPELVDANIVFAGNPDQVYEQIAEFCDYVGGIGNLIMMCHGGELSHADAMENLRLFATQVMPRLKERYPAQAPVSAAAE